MRKSHQKKAILIIRLTAIGDIILASPVATSIKSANPNTEIVWLSHTLFTPLLKGHPDVDGVIPFDTDAWEKLWYEKRLLKLSKMARDIRHLLHNYKFERVIDLQGNTISGILSLLSGAAHRIALGSARANSWFMTKTISRNLGEQVQIGSEYRYLINQLGYSDAEWKMYVPQTDEAEKQAEHRIHNMLSDKPYAIICPFAQQAQKNWFEDYWEQLILRLRGRYKLQTIVLGRKTGSDSAAQIADKSGAINLVGATSIAETAALIRRATLLVGVDTGMTHMGHAVGIPCISLFGATYPYAYVESENSKIIFLDRYCSPCRHHPTCGGQYQCMREITPDMVLTAIKPLMKNTDYALSI